MCGQVRNNRVLARLLHMEDVEFEDVDSSKSPSLQGKAAYACHRELVRTGELDKMFPTEQEKREREDRVQASKKSFKTAFDAVSLMPGPCSCHST